MSSFTKPLKLEYLDGRQWKVLETFVYHVGAEDSGFAIKVPKGFITDFASIPRFFWRVLPPTGKYGKAAVLHDWLYSYGNYARIYADSVFLEAMQVLQVPPWQRYAMYKAVRMFGWIAWNKHRKKK